MKRLYAVDALRAFCIAIVMGGHFYNPRFTRFAPSDVFLNAIGPFFRNGRLGVTGFFVVSGFLITRLLLQDGSRPCLPLKEFYVRRAARLLPLLLSSMLLGWAVMAFHLGNPKSAEILYGQLPGHFTVGFWVSIVLFYFNWYAHSLTTIVSHSFGLHWIILWSLAVEEQFYLFYPLALRKSFSLNKVFLFIGAVALLGVAFRVWAFSRNPMDPDWMNLTPAALDPLVLGGGAYLVWDKTREELGKSPASSFLLALSGALITLRVIWTYEDRLLSLIFSHFLIAVGCSMFLIGACSLPSRWDSVFKPWAWFGGLSYGLYLLHVSVFFFVSPYMFKIYSYDKGAALYFSVTICVAWFCHRYYEMPANRWICKLFGVSHRSK